MVIEMDGLMVYDNSDKPFGEKVEAAAKAYEKKYGCYPEVCFVNPSEFENVDADVEIEELATIPSGHFWVGIEGVYWRQ